MSDCHFHDVFVAHFSERFRRLPSLDEIDRHFSMLASVEIIRATGRGGPSPRPLRPAQLHSTYRKLAEERRSSGTITLRAIDSDCAQLH